MHRFLGVPVLAAAVMISSLAQAAAPVKIVAAENFYGDLATQIGGDLVNVTSILSNPDDDPHLFEASASTAESIATAQIIVYNGADYDPWMQKLLSASEKQPSTKIVAADLIGRKSGDNPHIWYDPATLPAVATALEKDLEIRDPDDAATFKKNLATFESSFSAVMAQVSAIKAKHEGLVVTATEPVFGYMAGALGFKMLNIDFQVAVMNDAEPSASQVIAFEKSLTGGAAKVLFYNSQVTDKTTARLLDMAKANKVIVVGVTETEPKGKTIQTWFGGQLDEIKRALP